MVHKLFRIYSDTSLAKVDETENRWRIMFWMRNYCVIQNYWILNFWNYALWYISAFLHLIFPWNAVLSCFLSFSVLSLYHLFLLFHLFPQHLFVWYGFSYSHWTHFPHYDFDKECTLLSIFVWLKFLLPVLLTTLCILCFFLSLQAIPLTCSQIACPILLPAPRS